MSDENDPWRRDPQDRSSRVHVGLFLWIGLILAVGIGVWLLSILFPGQISSEDDSHLRIIRSIGVLALISSGLLYARRIRFGEVARNIAVWTGLAAIILVGYTYRTELEEVFYRVSGELVPSHAIATDDNGLVITASADGHFYVDGKANGQRIRFMIDTGASNVTLSPRDASRIGVDMSGLQFTQRYETANGTGLGAPYRLNSLSIGSFELADIEVSINRSDMSTSLLGMSFLERFGSFEFRGSRLILRR